MTAKDKSEKLNYSEWSRRLAISIKHYPQIKNKWKISRFKTMYRNGLSVNEAFRCWYVAH